MLLIHSKKAAFVFSMALFAISATFFIACKKEYSTESNGFTTTPPDLTTKVNAAVSGFITDENNEAIANAGVTIGNKSTFSDKYGFFEINNVEVIKEAGLVTVDYPGYFKGIKTYMATEGKSAFFRIKLIPKIIIGNINAATGGNVILTNGLSISLPANGVVNIATNTAYNGQVNIAAHWINPTANDLNQVMPGDLRGLDMAGSMKLLTTYGMVAVELTGAGGELLQVADNKKATLTVPLPAGLVASAPATIPLWYFDELTGLWKEEGKAIKSGNSYTGEVSHFSYWNCDVPANFVRFKCTVTNAKGIPITNAYVKISVAGNPQRAGYGYTDSSGYTSGAVPANSQLLLEVFGEYNCLSGLLAKNFTTTSTNVDLGKIIIPAAYSSTITGNVNNCSNAAVTNGFIILKKDGLNFHQVLSNTGSFSFTTALCSTNSPASFFAEDKDALKASEVFNTLLTEGPNPMGTIIACNVSTLQFINYSIDGANYSYTMPGDSVYQYAKPQNTPQTIFVNAFNANSNSSQAVSLMLLQTGIGVNSSQNLFSFTCPQLNNIASLPTPIAVKITEYGTIGQFMAGNFSGTFKGPAPGNISYLVTGNFRVRRSQ